MRDLLKINKILCIQNYGTSGTLFTQSLLDGHPELLSIPGLYGIDPIIAWKNIFGNLKFVKKNEIKKLIKFFIIFSDYWFKIKESEHGLNELGGKKNIKIKLPKNFFLKRLDYYLKNKEYVYRKDFLILTYIIFNEYYNRNLKNISYIIFPIHARSVEVMDILIEDFKKIKVLHVVRNTSQNFGSLIKQYKFSNILKSWIKCALFQICLDRALTNTRSIFGRNVFGKKPYYKKLKNFRSKAVRLEDIHLNFHKTFNKICLWLDINWNDSLTKSTFMDFLWGNRKGSIQISGLNTIIINQKHDEFLNSLDKLRINLLTLKERKHFKYINKEQYKNELMKMLIMPIIVWLPFKSELILSRWSSLFFGLYKNLSLKKIVTKLIFILPSKKNILYETFFVEKSLQILALEKKNYIKKIDFYIVKRNLLNITKSIFATLFIIPISLFDYFIVRIVMIFIIAKIFLFNDQKEYVKNL